MLKKQTERTKNSSIKRMERKHDVSPTEKEMLSNVASDLLTGNHLLGRPRTLEYKRLLSEFTTAAGIANEGKRLTRRQAALLKEMETIFHDGREDMAEQLGIDLEKLNNALHRRELLDEIVNKVVEFASSVYTNNKSALAAIVTADYDEEFGVLFDYLIGIENYVKKLKEGLTELNNEENG